MADLIRADPEVLDAYASVARGARIQLLTPLARYRRAWDALSAAEAVPAIAVPPSRADAVEAALADLRELDGLTGVMARALRELDHDGDGAISAADGLLLVDHPELFALLFPEGDDAAGEVMLEALLEDFDLLAGLVGHRDGAVSLGDIGDALDDPAVPLRLQASIQWLVDNPTVLEVMMWETAERLAYLRADDIELFLETNEHLRNLVGHTAALDTAARGGTPDGYVSREDLAAAASDTSLPRSVRAAAEHLLEHPRLLASITGPPSPDTAHGVADFGDGLTARLINGQAFAHDPGAAARFVRTLEVPVDGATGVPIWATSSDGFVALTNAALRDVEGSLSGTQEIIARLPETSEGHRNRLITSFYDLVAHRADTVFAEAAGATPGDPTSAGHPGANWLQFAPWASDGVHDVITGDFRALGVISPSMGARQAAADGNQWIFDDITSRFVAFVELHEDTGGVPSAAELQTFFETSFDLGDRQIREGFQAYTAALSEDDPVRRQQLMFQGNTLVAIHEQAGAQPWLERLNPGWLDEEAVRFIDVDMGQVSEDQRRTIHVDLDLREFANDTNLVVPTPILDLDPARLTPADLAIPGVDLADIDGWEGDVEISTTRWYEEAAGWPNPGPDAYQPPFDHPSESLSGSGATSWTDFHQRMWHIHRMFEQLHTDPGIHDTGQLLAERDRTWLDDRLRSEVGR